jgi:death-on-curing protein
MACRYIDLIDYLLIAEQVLEIPAEELDRLQRLGLADSALNAPAAGFAGVEAYPEFERKVAVLGWHQIKNHPLPDGNKRCALLSMIEFTQRNDRTWTPDPDDPEAGDAVIRGVAAGSVGEAELAEWVLKRIGDA